MAGVDRQRISGESASYTAQQIATLERLEGDVLNSLGYVLSLPVLAAVAATFVLVSFTGLAFL